MAKKRKSITENQQTLLYNEVDGLCPLCTKPLMYEKANTKQKKQNIAHIYPFSPTKDEEELLKNEERLSQDVDDINNLILLCPECHLIFDKPRTVDGYREIVKIKKELIDETKAREKYFDNNIRDEIKDILNFLANETDFESKDIDIEYDPKTIDKKTNKTIRPLTKRKIKYDVEDFYYIIKSKLKDIDSLKPTTSDIIALQIKTYYLTLKQINQEQEVIYNSLVDWLNKKTKSISEDASRIVISFFVQNCEVFE